MLIPIPRKMVFKLWQGPADMTRNKQPTSDETQVQIQYDWIIRLTGLLAELLMQNQEQMEQDTTGPVSAWNFSVGVTVKSLI